jgi:putative membrane protein
MRGQEVLSAKWIAAPALPALLMAPGAVGASNSLSDLAELCLAGAAPVTRDSLLASWSLAPAVVLPLLAVLALYVCGVWRMRMRSDASVVTRWRMASAALGWLVLAIALVSPLCRLAATLATAHMIQHVLLIAVAPFFLVMSAPLVPIVCGLPHAWRRPLLDRLGASNGGAAREGLLRPSPLMVGALFGASVWGWHLPSVYEAALQNAALHLLMYAALLLVGVVFWHSAIASASERTLEHGGAVVAAFSTTAHTGALGALLTFSPVVWYPIHRQGPSAWALTPLEDQQLAGLIMWVPMSFILLVCALWLLGRWLQAIAASGRAPAGVDGTSVDLRLR